MPRRDKAVNTKKPVQPTLVSANAYDKQARICYKGKAWTDITGRAKAADGMTIDEALQTRYHNIRGSVVQYTLSELNDDIAIGNLELCSSADTELDASGTSDRAPGEHDESAGPEEPVTIDQHFRLVTALENVRLEVEHEGDEISVADDLQMISDAIVQLFSSAHERKDLEQCLERARQKLRKAAPTAAVEHNPGVVDDVTQRTKPSTKAEDGQDVVNFYCLLRGINNSDSKDVQSPPVTADIQVAYPVPDEQAVHMRTVIIVDPSGVATVMPALHDNGSESEASMQETVDINVSGLVLPIDTDIDPMLIHKLREIGKSPEEIEKLSENILDPELFQVSMFSLSNS